LEYVSKPNNASKSTVNRTLPAIEILAQWQMADFLENESRISNSAVFMQ
jgi:hypothetical protein